jgi:hypothetical protein
MFFLLLHCSVALSNLSRGNRRSTTVRSSAINCDGNTKGERNIRFLCNRHSVTFRPAHPAAAVRHDDGGLGMAAVVFHNIKRTCEQTAPKTPVQAFELHASVRSLCSDPDAQSAGSAYRCKTVHSRQTDARQLSCCSAIGNMQRKVRPNGQIFAAHFIQQLAAFVQNRKQDLRPPALRFKIKLHYPLFLSCVLNWCYSIIFPFTRQAIIPPAGNISPATRRK